MYTVKPLKIQNALGEYVIINSYGFMLQCKEHGK